MHWPFVSRAAFDAVCQERDRLVAERDRLLQQMLASQQGTLADVIAIARESRQAPVAAEPPKSPLSALGPKAHAALAHMGRGQSPEVRRGMQVKALALHAEGLKDEDLAQRILDGEPVSL